VTQRGIQGEGRLERRQGRREQRARRRIRAFKNIKGQGEYGSTTEEENEESRGSNFRGDERAAETPPSSCSKENGGGINTDIGRRRTLIQRSLGKQY